MSADARATALQSSGRASNLASALKRDVQGVGTTQEMALWTPPRQHEVIKLAAANNKQIKDDNLNAKFILSPAQIEAKQKLEGVVQKSKWCDTGEAGIKCEIDADLVRGAEPSENNGYQSVSEGHDIAADLNNRYKQASLLASKGSSVPSTIAYLKERGITTTGRGGPVGENSIKALARLDKLLQEYRLTYKLDMIRQLDPIDARAYAAAKPSSGANRGRSKHINHHNAQDSQQNQHASNLATAAGPAAARLDFFTPKSSATRTQSTKPAKGFEKD